MAHFPVSAIVKGGPARTLPVSVKLPVDGSHIFDIWGGHESLLALKFNFHTHALLDLSQPSVIREVILVLNVFRNRIMTPRLVYHDIVVLVESGPQLHKSAILTPIIGN